MRQRALSKDPDGVSFFHADLGNSPDAPSLERLEAVFKPETVQGSFDSAPITQLDQADSGAALRMTPHGSFFSLDIRFAIVY
jgi:hypothetical protein